MAEVKWIKITTDIFDDEKILLIESMPEADALIVIWFKLLCLAGKQNNDGIFTISDKIPYTDEMLATIFRRPVNIVRLALQTFEHFGMVQRIEGVITIPNWGKHQSVDRLQDIREYNKIAKRKQREKEKVKLVNDVNDMSMTCQHRIDKTRLDKDIDIHAMPNSQDIETETKSEPETRKREDLAVDGTDGTPSLSDVEEFCRGYGIRNIQPKTFFKQMEEAGWMTHGRPVSNWRGLLTSWDRARERSSTVISATPDEPDAFTVQVLAQMRQEGTG